MNSVSTESTCPICFEVLNKKIKASPDNCEHIFCFPCLEKWSKLASYCPVDRKRFKKILNLDSEDVVQVKPRKRKRKRIFYDFTTKCEVCSGCTDSNVMLLCDCCDLGYHIHCLRPPLKEVPAGVWFCPTCISVEEKLKKKNGITKEVEAELGGFDSYLFKTNSKDKEMNEKTSMKTEKISNPAPVVKNTSILQTCQDIISGFEDMTVRKNCSKNACSSDYLDSAISKIDKIYKTFDSVSKDSNNVNTKHLKTYSVTSKKAKVTKVFDFKQTYQKNLISLNTADTCINQDNVSTDINLENYTSTETVSNEFLDVGILYKDDELSKNEMGVEKINLNADDSQIELFSEENNIHSDELFEKFSQRSSLELNPPPLSPHKHIFKSGNMPELQKTISKSYRKKSRDNMPVLEKQDYRNNEKSLAKEQKKFKKYVISSDSENGILSSTSCIREKPSKGTSKHLIQFSIFQKIEGIDASQEICSQISAVEVPFPSNRNTHMQQCPSCNNEFFSESEIWCKLCKLKRINWKKKKKFSDYLKNFKKELGCKKYENINLNQGKYDSRVIENRKNVMSNNSSSLERRKRSLIRTLKKIHNSKCINVPVN